MAIAQQVFIVGEGGGIGPILARRVTGDDTQTMKKAIAVAYLISALGLAVTAPLVNLPLGAAGDDRA